MNRAVVALGQRQRVGSSRAHQHAVAGPLEHLLRQHPNQPFVLGD